MKNKQKIIKNRIADKQAQQRIAAMFLSRKTAQINKEFAKEFASLAKEFASLDSFVLK